MPNRKHQRRCRAPTERGFSDQGRSGPHCLADARPASGVASNRINRILSAACSAPRPSGELDLVSRITSRSAGGLPQLRGSSSVSSRLSSASMTARRAEAPSRACGSRPLQQSDTLLPAPHNRPYLAVADRGKGRPKAHPEGKRSALPAIRRSRDHRPGWSGLPVARTAPDNRTGQPLTYGAGGPPVPIQSPRRSAGAMLDRWRPTVKPQFRRRIHRSSRRLRRGCSRSTSTL
jgi:hypothetical protein